MGSLEVCPLPPPPPAAALPTRLALSCNRIVIAQETAPIRRSCCFREGIDDRNKRGVGSPIQQPMVERQPTAGVAHAGSVGMGGQYSGDHVGIGASDHPVVERQLLAHPLKPPRRVREGFQQQCNRGEWTPFLQRTV
jgi:hypothetical protein